MSNPSDLQKLITLHQRRLQKLKEQQAIRGISTPPEVLTEIEEIEAEIGRLEAVAAEQGQLRQTLDNLPPGLNLPGAADFRRQIEARLAELSRQIQVLAESRTTFDQRGQQVGWQINVAGDYIGGTAPPAADPLELRRAYLSRLIGQTRRLPLDTLDPKTMGAEDSREL